jgi:hypothetical protein
MLVGGECRLLLGTTEWASRPSRQDETLLLVSEAQWFRDWGCERMNTIVE